MLRLTVDPLDSGKLIGFPPAPPGTGPVRFANSSLLRAHPEDPRTPHNAEPTRIVAWTGSYAELDGGGPFDADPRTWGAAGWSALELACAAATEDANVTVLIRPHARHVVSDVPGIRRFATTIAARCRGRFELLLDPASMLDTAHLDRGTAADTLRRIAEELPTFHTPDFPLAGVVVANVRRTDDGLKAAPVDAGELDPALIKHLFG